MKRNSLEMESTIHEILIIGPTPIHILPCKLTFGTDLQLTRRRGWECGFNTVMHHLTSADKQLNTLIASTLIAGLVALIHESGLRGHQDLTPLDYSLWMQKKYMIYQRKSQPRAEILYRIMESADRMQENGWIIRKATVSFETRTIVHR